MHPWNEELGEDKDVHQIWGWMMGCQFGCQSSEAAGCRLEPLPVQLALSVMLIAAPKHFISLADYLFVRGLLPDMGCYRAEPRGRGASTE